MCYGNRLFGVADIFFTIDLHMSMFLVTKFTDFEAAPVNKLPMRSENVIETNKITIRIVRFSGEEISARYA